MNWVEGVSITGKPLIPPFDIVINYFIEMAESQLPPKQCGVCLDAKLVLKELPCGHEYCLECLETLRRGRPSFTCPNCRAETTIQGETAKGFPNRYNGSLVCGNGACQERLRVDRLKWCVECHSHLCIPCAERTAHFRLQHTTKSFDSLESVKSACGKISAEYRESNVAAVESFVAVLKEALLFRVQQELSPTEVMLRTTFGLGEAKFGTGGLSTSQAQNIAQETLGMMGVTVGDQSGPILTRDLVNSAVDSALHDLHSNIGPIVESPDVPQTAAGDPSLAILCGREIEKLYPFSDTPSTLHIVQELPEKNYGACLTSSGNILVAGGWPAKDSNCWLLDSNLRLTNDGLPPPHIATQRQSPVTARVGQTIYIIGGADYSDVDLTTCFALRNSGWEAAPSLPRISDFLSATEYERKIFALGTDQNAKPDQFLELDPEGNGWSSLQLPGSGKFDRHCIASINNSIYALDVEADRLHVYRPEIGTWSLGPTLPQTAFLIRRCGDRLIALIPFPSSRVVQVYEPRMERWEVSQKKRSSDGYIYDCVAMP